MYFNSATTYLFQPPCNNAAVVELKSPLVLKAIVISDDKDKAIAIIQDRLFRVGDVINDYKIIKIEKNKVHLLDNNQNTSILTLY
ncbi:MAG: hypothetical protein P8P83_03805 [Rickettsiaceae bacterium]|nr:hypothetical protein [Rickettsiaceae bacterium]